MISDEKIIAATIERHIDAHHFKRSRLLLHTNASLLSIFTFNAELFSFNTFCITIKAKSQVTYVAPMPTIILLFLH